MNPRSSKFNNRWKRPFILKPLLPRCLGIMPLLFLLLQWSLFLLILVLLLLPQLTLLQRFHYRLVLQRLLLLLHHQIFLLSFLLLLHLHLHLLFHLLQPFLPLCLLFLLLIRFSLALLLPLCPIWLLDLLFLLERFVLELVVFYLRCVSTVCFCNPLRVVLPILPLILSWFRGKCPSCHFPLMVQRNIDICNMFWCVLFLLLAFSLFITCPLSGGSWRRSGWRWSTSLPWAEEA